MCLLSPGRRSHSDTRLHEHANAVNQTDSGASQRQFRRQSRASSTCHQCHKTYTGHSHKGGQHDETCFDSQFFIIGRAWWVRGGGDSDVTTTSGLIPFTNGDSYTYSIDQTSVTGTPPEPANYRFTRVVRNPKPTLDYERLTTYSTNFTWSSGQINSDNFQIERTSGSTKCTTTAGQSNPGFSIEVGETWNSQYTETCATNSTSSTTQVTDQGKVLARENYTAAGQNFDTFKTERTATYQYPTGLETATSTCWFDTKSAQVVACNANNKFVPTGATTPSREYKTAQRLSSLAVRNHPQSKPSVERFAGNWRINWTGSNGGKCDVVIALSGSLSGSCETGSSPYITFSVSGSVSNAGNINVSSTNGAIFSGSFEDPAFAKGSWSNTGTSGTWTGGHL